jgi:hypothetical protein
MYLTRETPEPPNAEIANPVHADKPSTHKWPRPPIGQASFAIYYGSTPPASRLETGLTAPIRVVPASNRRACSQFARGSPVRMSCRNAAIVPSVESLLRPRVRPARGRIPRSGAARFHLPLSKQPQALVTMQCSISNSGGNRQAPLPYRRQVRSGVSLAPRLYSPAREHPANPNAPGARLNWPSRHVATPSFAGIRLTALSQSSKKQASDIVFPHT